MLNQKQLDTFGGASQSITDAYILWILSNLEGYGVEVLGPEYKNLEKLAASTQDPYILSLCAGVFYNIGKIDLARQYADSVTKMQNQTSGSVQGAISSITSSNGDNLLVETTSLAVLNWLNIDTSRYSVNIELAIGYLMKSVKDGGRYGSTQATVLCLKALVKYARIFGGLKGSGNFVLYFNGQKVAS